MANKWRNRLKVFRVSKPAIIISFILILIFIAFTIYGNKVGNFVVNVTKGEKYLRLTEHEDFSKQTSRLTFSGLKEQTDMTFDGKDGIPDDISKGIGAKNDKNGCYIAYSFYLLNSMNTALSYQMTINLLDATRGLDKTVRVMIIENDNSKWDSYIYAKPEATLEDEQRLKDHTKYTTIPFKSDTIISSESFTLKYGAHIKYTIVMWIEGWDADTDNTILHGSLKMDMSFTVNE